jgi:signal transduction histidine kinase
LDSYCRATFALRGGRNRWDGRFAQRGLSTPVAFRICGLAEANADYIRDNIEAENEEDAKEFRPRPTPISCATPILVQTEFLADHLSQFRGVEVQFQRVAAPDARHEAVTVPINSGAELTLIRERPRLRDVLLQPISLGALTAFWALWFALAWAVTLPYLDAQRFGLLGSIATSLAHEIRNPIAAIRLHGQLLEQTEPVSAGLIVYEAAKIEDMLNQWMFLARPEPPRKTEIASGGIDRSNRASARARRRSRQSPYCSNGLALSARPGGHSPPRPGFSQHHPQCHPSHARRRNTFHHRFGKDICFADTGPGFSPTALRRAAETLYSEKEGGMGLGLSVARKIVRAHDGRLIIGNRPEGGAVVRVIL